MTSSFEIKRDRAGFSRGVRAAAEGRRARPQLWWWYPPTHESFNVLTYSERAGRLQPGQSPIGVGEKVTLVPNEQWVDQHATGKSQSKLTLDHTGSSAATNFGGGACLREDRNSALVGTEAVALVLA